MMSENIYLCTERESGQSPPPPMLEMSSPKAGPVFHLCALNKQLNLWRGMQIEAWFPTAGVTQDRKQILPPPELCPLVHPFI